MQPQPPLTLRGDFSFDAFSADGRTLYLTEYTSRNLSDYAVREYDLERQRLLREPVLVAHEVSPGEMRGVPVTRTTSPDGRWAYTLYDRGGRRDEVAFIHTLDTERGISHCVDLSMVSGEDAWRVDLELTDGGGTLHATRGNEVVAMLDTETFALSEPLAPEATATGDDGGVPGGVAIGAFIAGVALLAGAALGLRRRRNDTSLPTDPFGTPEPDVEPERGRVST
jgi:MYXO-CTERM domain-containing protein